jgi:hypothetical protein
MNQVAKGLCGKSRPSPDDGEVDVLDAARIDKTLEQLKWYLWHGNVYQALKRIEFLEWDLEEWEADSEVAAKLLAAVREFCHYIEVNRNAIPNYGDRYRHGEMISTSFVESAVNQIVSKRMVKLQQMRWSKRLERASFYKSALVYSTTNLRIHFPIGIPGWKQTQERDRAQRSPRFAPVSLTLREMSRNLESGL